MWGKQGDWGQEGGDPETRRVIQPSTFPFSLLLGGGGVVVFFVLFL